VKLKGKKTNYKKWSTNNNMLILLVKESLKDMTIGLPLLSLDTHKKKTKILQSLSQDPEIKV